MSSDLFTVNGKQHPSACLTDGQMYAIIMSDEHDTHALVWGALLAAADSARPAYLVTDNDPQRFLSSTDKLAQSAGSALMSGKINLLRLDASAFSQLHRAASQQLLDEFEHFSIPDHALLIVDHAELLFDESAFDKRTSRIADWRNWAEKKHASPLLLFRMRENRASNLSSHLMRSAHFFGGIARMHFAEDMLRWTIMSWFGANASVVTDKTWQLLAGESGRLAGSDMPVTETLVEAAADEDAVYAMKSIFTENQMTGSDWHWIEDINTLQTQIAGAVAATIILSFDRATSLDKLAHTIYGLRLHHGSRIKIIIRELDARLRYSQEALMTRLGANLIVPAELGHSRFLSMVSMIQGQRLSRTLPASYEEAILQSTHKQGQGYLPPKKFVEAVTHALHLSRSLALQNALLDLPLAHGLTPVDALRYFIAKRNGDFCTADENGIYIFLSACREADVDIALRNSFYLPVDDLFNSETRYLSTQTIRLAIEDLTERIATGAQPDFTGILAALSAREDLSDSAPVQQTASGKPAAKTRPVSPAATPHPLTLRTPLLSEQTGTKS